MLSVKGRYWALHPAVKIGIKQKTAQTWWFGAAFIEMLGFSFIDFLHLYIAETYFFIV